MTNKQIEKSHKEWKKMLLETDREVNQDRADELIDRFGIDRLKELRKSLDTIQNNQFAWSLFTKERPLVVTPEELIFLEEEDRRTTKRYMVDFGLEEYDEEDDHWLPRWVRMPFQSDAQVKRTLKHLLKTNQKFDDLRIIDDQTLNFTCIEPGKPLPDPKLEDYFTPREVLFGKTYVKGSQFDWKHKIEFSHKVNIEVKVNDKKKTH